MYRAEIERMVREELTTSTDVEIAEAAREASKTEAEDDAALDYARVAQGLPPTRAYDEDC